MWTINDFPTYGILSEWSTNGQFACPVCMKQQKVLRLKNGGKFLWFDYHRCFLPRNHASRRNRTSFRKEEIVMGGPSHHIFGDQLYTEVEHYSIVTTKGDFQILEFKKNEHNWAKKSMFWELS